MKVIVAILVALVLLVIAQNATVVTLRFLFWKASLSLVLVFLFVGAIALIAGYLLGRLSRRRDRGDERS